MDADITLHVDGVPRPVTVDTRTTLLDALRERLGVTSPKKGCDHGQCGACTVLLDGRRMLACLALAVAYDGREVTTAEGLARGSELHPVQQAFLDHDGFQCGYCTPGQVCSAVGRPGLGQAVLQPRPRAVPAGGRRALRLGRPRPAPWRPARRRLVGRHRRGVVDLPGDAAALQRRDPVRRRALRSPGSGPPTSVPVPGRCCRRSPPTRSACPPRTSTC